MDQFGELINISASKLSLTNDICKMNLLTIKHGETTFSSNNGQISTSSLSGHLKNNVIFSNKNIHAKTDKVFIDLSKKIFRTKHKIIAKLKNIIISSDGAEYQKQQSKITFLKNVKVLIN